MTSPKPKLSWEEAMPLLPSKPARSARPRKTLSSSHQRFKAPPTLPYPSHTPDKNTAVVQSSKQAPTKQEQEGRLMAAAAELEGENDAKDSRKPLSVKYCHNRVIPLIQAKQPALVIIALMSTPSSLPSSSPSRARSASHYIHKTAAVVSLQEVKGEDRHELASLVSASKADCSDKDEELCVVSVATAQLFRKRTDQGTSGASLVKL